MAIFKEMKYFAFIMPRVSGFFRIPTVPLGGASLASAYPNMSAVPVEEIVKDETNVENLLNNPVKL